MRFHIIRNLETMHDWHLPTFYVRALRIIWKRTRKLGVVKSIRRAGREAPYEFLVGGKWLQRKSLGSDPAASLANYKDHILSFTC